jgi:hypothetical protein
MIQPAMEAAQRLLGSPLFHSFCLAIVAVAAVLAVLSRIYDDTLSQRIALALIALGATVQISLIMHTGYTSPGWGFMLAGVALYAAATVAKVWTRWRAAGRPDHPFRRSTDWDTLSPPPPGAMPTSPPAWQETVPTKDRRTSFPAA